MNAGPISPVADVHGATPRVLANAGTHSQPTQPTPISPVADVHGATPLVLADAGTHPQPTQPTPISPVADVHGATPLALANAGTHSHPTQPTPISPVADVHGATPLVLANAVTHPQPTQPTPISPVANVHGATPLVLANPGTHSRTPSVIPAFARIQPRRLSRTNRGRSQTTVPYNRHSGECRNPSPSVITNTPSATTMKIAPHTSPCRGNPLWLPSPNVLADAGTHPRLTMQNFDFHPLFAQGKAIAILSAAKNLLSDNQRRIG